jgi:hypothetical protein
VSAYVGAWRFVRRDWSPDVTDLAAQPWIKGYALRPRHLSHGGWIWLRPYEWRWARPEGSAPMAILPPVVQSRRLA